MSGALAPVSILGSLLAMVIDVQKNVKLIPSSLPIPRTKSQFRSFLGTTGYYCDFIPAYASHSYYLTEAIKKTAPTLVFGRL